MGNDINNSQPVSVSHWPTKLSQILTLYNSMVMTDGLCAEVRNDIHV